jgi:putative addiction module killer protein
VGYNKNGRNGMIGDTERTLLVLLQDNDKSLVEEWLGKIRDKTTLVKIVFQIDKLSRGLGLTKNVKVVSELKIDLGPGYRVYYALLDADTIVVLIGGGSKKTQSRDIQDAQNLWDAFVKSDRPEAALRAWQRDQRLVSGAEGTETGNSEGEENETQKL